MATKKNACSKALKPFQFGALSLGAGTPHWGCIHQVGELVRIVVAE